MRVHYINRESISVAFFPETKRFFQINEKAKSLIDAILSGTPKKKVMEDFEIEESTYQKYYNNIFDNTLAKNNQIFLQENSNQRILNRLVIHLTNDCNMRCQYCYAHGGNYLSNRDIMAFDTFDQLIHVFFQKFDVIKVVQFFGGEPLMNIPLLQYACEQFELRALERNYTINFGIVTNGTLMDTKFIELVKKYSINVTVSYDGHPLVNDIMRVMEDHTGSSSIILEQAKKLKEETGQPNTIEVTYNQHHVNHGVGILECVQHIQEELPDTYVHLIPAGDIGTSDYAISDLSIFADSIHELAKQNEETNGKNVSMYSLAQRIFFALNNREANVPLICDAGLGTLSVSTKGEVFPCFMFTDDAAMSYGNIADPDLFESTQSRRLQDRLNSFSVKENNQECRDCFIKKLCNGCLGLNSFHSGNPFKLAPPLCDMFRKMTEEALIEHTKIHEKQKGLVKNHV